MPNRYTTVSDWLHEARRFTDVPATVLELEREKVEAFPVVPPVSKRASLNDFGREPFRLLFPAGVLAGIVGVALWPLHFLGLVELYPGMAHARIMACGLFGAFIFGF